MEAKESHVMIETQTPSGDRVPLRRFGWLVPTQPRGVGAKAPLPPIRYELKTGEPVEHLEANVWLHPLTGERLQLVVYGEGK